VKNDASDGELEARLAARFQVDVERARTDLAETRPMQRRNSSSAPSAGLIVLAAVALLAATLLGGSLLGGHGLTAEEATVAPTALAAPETSLPTPPSVSATDLPTPSPRLVDGLPVELGGVAVVRGQVALDAIHDSAPGDQLLVGGWLADPRPLSCPGQEIGAWWNQCDAAQIHDSAFSGPTMFLYLGPAPVTIPRVATGQTGAIVLAVHTHDKTCPASGDCAALPVVDEIVWFGGVVPMPTGFPGAPSKGLSRDRAISIAEGYAKAQAQGSIKVEVATSAPYGSVQPEGSEVSADRWVWTIVFSGSFPAPGCDTSGCAAANSLLVILDYVSGDLVLEQAPA
jgi:hypothetical protein